jgi:hypothetical protein
MLFCQQLAWPMISTSAAVALILCLIVLFVEMLAEQATTDPT